MAESVPLVAVWRGAVRESVHTGSYVVVEGDTILEERGTSDQVVYYRSTAKPFQALVLVTSGAFDRFALDPEALAIAGGSHDARPEQLDAVRTMLDRAQIGEEQLACAGHWSIDKAHARVQVRELGAEPATLPPLWSNCSGKHAAMLAAAKASGAALDGYLDRGHPVQQSILASLTAFSGVARDELAVAVDGCGAPIAGVPLVAMARSLARLGRPDGMSSAYRDAAQRVGQAMRAHPLLVAGPGRFDTDLMQATDAPLVAKAGAEGVHGLYVLGRGFGLAVKVDDGSDRGYRQVVIELLRRRGLLTDQAADDLAERHGRTVRNWGGEPVGRLEVLI